MIAKVPNGSVPKTRRWWCCTRNWGQPTSPYPKSRSHLKGIAVFFTQEVVPNFVQTSQPSWTGKINTRTWTHLSRNSQTHQNETKRHWTPNRCNNTSYGVTCGKYSCFTHMFMRGFAWWVMTNQFDLLQKGGFSQSIVVCIKENHLTWPTIEIPTRYDDDGTWISPKHPPKPLRTFECPWRGEKICKDMES